MRSAAASPSRPLRTRELRRASGLDPLDAEVLLAHVLGVDRAALHRDDPEPTPAQAERFAALAARRRGGEPVAHLTGRQAFRWLELEVDARVLVPRPETEELVELALAALPRGARVADVGTGSGAIALALAAERPDLEVVGSDVSPDALAVARANAERLGLVGRGTGAEGREGAGTTGPRLSWALGDGLAALAGPLDAVVANLPYVPDEAPLPVDVRDFDPPLALFGGPDGLDVIRRLAAELPARGRPSVFLEVGEGQAEPVAELLRRAGYTEPRIHADLRGVDRFVVAEGAREG